MSTTTTHYAWVQPTPGGDPTTWGTELNTDLGLIDAQVWANQQAGAPVGTIVMFGGGVAPTNWLICNGASLATINYTTLFNVIGYAFGGSGANFNLPNFAGQFPVGAYGFSNMGATGGEANHTLSTAEMPVHSHFVEQTPHVHTITDVTHTHTDTGHPHTITDTHVHQYSAVVGGGSGMQSGSGERTAGVNTTGVSGGSIAINTGYAAITASGTNLAATNGQTANLVNSATDNAGSGGAHNNMPPYLGVNFIIRAV